MTEPINIAEEAFINAVVASMRTQDELIPLTKRLNAEMEKIASANERVLRSRGITDESPLEEVLSEQSKYLDEAIKRSGFGEDHMVVKALRNQLEELQESFRVMAAQYDEQLGKVDGPEL